MNPRLLTRKFAADPGAGGAPAPTPTPTPTPAAWHGDFKPDAPQEFRDWVANKAYPDAHAALFSAYNQEKLIGAERAGRTVLWPKDENDKEGWKAIHEKLGVPGSPDGYGITVQQGDDENLVKAMTGFMHARGIPKSAAVGFYQDVQKHLKEVADAAAAQAEAKAKEELAALDTEWGTAAAANKELGRRFALELGITAEEMQLVESALGTAKFMKIFHAGGKKLGELGGAPGAGGGGGVTQAQAKEQLEAARAKRSEGKLSESDWFEISARLSPIAYPAGG